MSKVQIYAVHDTWHGPVLEQTMAAKRAKTYKADKALAGYGYRFCISLVGAHLTPAAAINAYCDALCLEAATLEARAVEKRAKAAAARALFLDQWRS